MKACIKELREGEEKRTSMIDAIATVLKPVVGAADGLAGEAKPDTVTSGVPASTADAAEVAAAKLYGLMEQMTKDGKSTRKSGKSKKSGK